MKRMITIKKAENHLAELVQEVLAGGEVIISSAGQPVVRIVKYEEEPVEQFVKLNFGAAKGRLPSFTDEEWEQLDEEIRATYDEDAKWPGEL